MSAGLEGASCTPGMGRRMEKLGEGREAEIFATGPQTVLKLYREDSAGAFERERRALAALPAGLGPRLVGTTTVGSRPGLELERVDGVDLLTLIGTAPWRLLELGTVMGREHARIHAAPAPAHLPRHKQSVRERVSTSPHVAAEIALLAVARLDALPDGEQVCHGDFHPGNVVRVAGSARTLDWPNACAGHPDGDVAATLVILRLGEPPRESPFAVRKLHKVGRGLLRARYLAGYARERPVNLDEVERWMLPAAIDRLSHGIPEERDGLLSLIATHT